MQDNKISKYPNAFYRVSLKAIIRNSEGKILVNKEQDSTTWNLPGGGWDHGETEKQAMARELLEEVGYVGDFDMELFSTAVFWLQSKEAWLLWIVYEITTENNDFSAGADSSVIDYIYPRDFRGHDAFEEKWIYENLK